MPIQFGRNIKSMPSSDQYRAGLDRTFDGTERSLSNAYVYEHARPDETLAEARGRLTREKVAEHIHHPTPDQRGNWSTDPHVRAVLMGLVQP